MLCSLKWITVVFLLYGVKNVLSGPPLDLTKESLDHVYSAGYLSPSDIMEGDDEENPKYTLDDKHDDFYFESGSSNTFNNDNVANKIKRSWKNMNVAWGKRRVAADWNKFRGSWGKREPGQWNNLKGYWGKRAGQWNKLQSAWGKRAYNQD